MKTQYHQAVLWESVDNQAVRCNLCHQHCLIKPDQTGICRVRKNIAGTLYSLNYDKICSLAVDPIEKKPLFHFQPGQYSFSLATVGCNFRCNFCQNWQISQFPRMQKSLAGQKYTPEQIVLAARENNCRSISYTYTEPTIFMELAADCGRLAKKSGLANVFVSNGYLTTRAIDFARDFLDGINVDLKSFNDDFYRNLCGARLSPVLETLRYIARQTDIWLEVTTLIVPQSNDDETELKQLARFIAEELGPHVPWHISRFYPAHQHTSVGPTPVAILENAYNWAKEAGLHYVYVGNCPGIDKENTYCHNCGKLLIGRNGYQVTEFNLLNGCCPDCQTALSGFDLNPVKINGL